MIKTLDLIIGKDFSGAMTWHIVRNSYRKPRFYGQYNALSSGRQLTPYTIARLHRAQLRLAGLPVSGWPWPDYCECEVCYPDETGQVPICKHCGKEIEI